MDVDIEMSDLSLSYGRDGFVSGVRIISGADASVCLRDLERTESIVGGLHYYNKVHLFMGSAYDLAISSVVLDIVEQLIGRDILLYNCTYIVKEVGSSAFVSWHQDLTYWGLSEDDDGQVSMWLALSSATGENGCMRMLAGSHRDGERLHRLAGDKDNVLDLGQTIEGVDESLAVLCPLRAGEASFHHGWTMHASSANMSDTRRVGLNVQYIAPHVSQSKIENDSAMLVRGIDRYKHYQEDEIISSELTRDNFGKLQAYRDRFVKTYNS